MSYQYQSVEMKKILYLFLFFVIALVNNVTAQSSDSIRCKWGRGTKLEADSTDAATRISRRAEIVLDAVFKPDEPVLNNADSIIKAFDDLPSFGIYKNNYIVTGTTITSEPTRYNSDAKFQISVSQRLTNSVLPFKTYLVLTYTQLAYWNIYQESFPFGDINFNPTIGIGKALVHKNRFLGTIMMQFEHESNGKDSLDSRSWNKISFGGMFKLNRNWTIQSKLWIPIVDGTNNKDIVNYKGFAHFGVDYSHKKKYNIGMLLTKRAGSFFDGNITLNYAYRLFNRENQYLFLEYVNGYGENMLEYKRHRNMVRIGFVIQPNFFHYY